MPAIRLSRLGFSQLAREDELDKLVEGSGKNFKYSMMEFFIGSETKAEKIPLPGFTSFESIDRQEIAAICQKYDLDAYICTEVRYKFINYKTLTLIGFYENGTSEDIQIEQILFDRNGDPQIRVMHDTFRGYFWTYMSFSNRYDSSPINTSFKILSSDKSFDEGVSRCMKRIMRKLNNKKKN